MEKHISNDCAEQILSLIKQYHKQGELTRLYMSQHDIFEKTLYLNKFEEAKLFIDNKTITLDKCPLSKLNTNSIFNKLKRNGYNMSSTNIPTKYIQYQDYYVQKFWSSYTYYKISESPLKSLYDIYNKFT